MKWKILEQTKGDQNAPRQGIESFRLRQDFPNIIGLANTGIALLSSIMSTDNYPIVGTTLVQLDYVMRHSLPSTLYLGQPYFVSLIREFLARAVQAPIIWLRMASLAGVLSSSDTSSAVPKTMFDVRSVVGTTPVRV
jgi:hypothetical protein